MTIERHQVKPPTEDITSRILPPPPISTVTKEKKHQLEIYQQLHKHQEPKKPLLTHKGENESKHRHPSAKQTKYKPNQPTFPLPPSIPSLLSQPYQRKKPLSRNHLPKTPPSQNRLRPKHPPIPRTRLAEQFQRLSLLAHNTQRLRTARDGIQSSRMLGSEGSAEAVHGGAVGGLDG